ncbi:MAG: hypothetical protein V1658_00775 [Candidatus Micrarchaeota archaeon]
MIGKFVKGTTRALGLLNQRAFTIILLFTGILAAMLLIPDLLTEGITKREAIGVILLVMLPYLILKGVVLITLLVLDIAVNFSAKTTFAYKLNYEKAKARIAKVLADRGLSFVVVDNFEFGIERYFVYMLQKYLAGSKFNYPANFICSKPFIVARIYDLKNSTSQVKVLYEEEREAEILGRIIVASLQALEQEELARIPQPQTSFIAGAIRMAIDSKSADADESGMRLSIPERKNEPPKAQPGLFEKLRGKKRKK